MEIVMALHSKVNGFRLSLQVGISGPTFGNEKIKDVWNQAGYTILESKNAKWSNFFFLQQVFIMALQESQSFTFTMRKN